jgi:hypothetical protein
MRALIVSGHVVQPALRVSLLTSELLPQAVTDVHLSRCPPTLQPDCKRSDLFAEW